MKIISSVTVFNDAVGVRMSATYSEVNDQTGQVIKDNQRFDRVITDEDAKNAVDLLKTYAFNSIPD